MLLCVVIVFLVCNVLPLVSNVYENMYVNPPGWLIQLGNLLVTFNSGVNFIIYVIFGRKFKRIFLKIFCRVSGETGLDCMGRPSRADSPDFQTNEDSIATNLSNVELRNSIRRLHGSHHHHHHHHGSHHGSNSLRPGGGGSTHSGGSNGYSRSSVYYPTSPKPGFYNNGSNHNNHHQHHHRDRSTNLEDTAFCWRAGLSRACVLRYYVCPLLCSASLLFSSLLDFFTCTWARAVYLYLYTYPLLFYRRELSATCSGSGMWTVCAWLLGKCIEIRLFIVCLICLIV